MTSQQPIHNDPEFITFNYGSPQYVKNNRKDKNYDTLSNMQTGDILVFYAAFTNKHENRNDVMGGLYFFSYFIVDQAITYDYPEALDNEKRRMVANNHHFIHGYENQVIVVGNPNCSRVFNKAVPLSLRVRDAKHIKYYPSPEILNILRNDSNKSTNLSSLRRITSDEKAKTFKAYLDMNSV